ncbi:hypothetical protein [Streptomyces sp. NPDC047868]|uniref:hypothetical protein n=1 Tax=Streptomyces sp. NPDC047868 TaxID=3155480 RepID=UPI00345435E3
MNRKQQALRQRTREQRTARRAFKATATGTPQTARTHLIAAGINDATAKRYAGAFSRGITADDTRDARIKLKKRTRKTVTVKLYSATTFAARLAVYRPKDLTAAALFEQAAHSLAA